METVAIFGVPRSGTSWLGQIFNSSPNVTYRYQPIFSYSFKEEISSQSSTSEIDRFHNKLYNTTDDFVLQTKNIRGNETPSFNKKEITHLVWKEVRYLDAIRNLIEKSDIKVIGLLRHPCGVIHSWKNAPKEFEKDWDLLEEWRYAKKKNQSKHDFFGFERWIEAAQLFVALKKDFPDQFFIQLYEKLVQNPLENTKLLLDFADIPMSSQTRLFLDKSTSHTSDDHYDVFRKNKTGFEWKKQLNPVIINEIKNDTRFIELENHFEWNTLEQQKK